MYKILRVMGALAVVCFFLSPTSQAFAAPSKTMDPAAALSAATTAAATEETKAKRGGSLLQQKRAENPSAPADMEPDRERGRDRERMMAEEKKRHEEARKQMLEERERYLAERAKAAEAITGKPVPTAPKK